MVIIYGESESLKYILKELSKTKFPFHSLEDIKHFQENWENDLKNHEQQQRDHLTEEIQEIEQTLHQSLAEYEIKLTESKKQLTLEKEALPGLIQQSESKNITNPISGLIQRFKLYRLQRRLKKLDTSFERESQRPLKHLTNQIQKQQKEISVKQCDFEKMIKRRSKSYVNQILKTKDILKQNYWKIAGAIGETMAVQELRNLPDSFVVFNDLHIKFTPPIYYRREKDQIVTIQVDHLVVGPPGVFVIETKHWSQESLKNKNLFSPVKQIQRTSFALFVALNERVRLPKHIIGRKKISVKNILLMTNAMPNQEVQYVKILSLNQLVSYIMYFEEIWSEKEINKVVKFLK
jgi:hypothetical protein